MLRFGIIAIVLAAIIAPIAFVTTLGQQGSTTEARVTARKLEDGRIEFGLQTRNGGSWGERLLPRGRFFPASAPVDRWLSSTGIGIGSSAGLFTPIIAHGQVRNISYSAGLNLGEGHVELDDPGVLVSTVRVEPSSQGNEQGRAFTTFLTLSCRSAYVYRSDSGEDFVRLEQPPSYGVFEGGVAFTFAAPAGVAGDDAIVSAYLRNEGPAIEDIGFGFVDVNYRYIAHARNSGEPAVLFRASREDGAQLDWWRTSLTIDRSFMFTLKRYAQYYDELTVGVIGIVGQDRDRNEAFRATFDFGEIFDTPIQSNLERCGEY